MAMDELVWTPAWRLPGRARNPFDDLFKDIDLLVCPAIARTACEQERLWAQLRRRGWIRQS